MATNLSEGSISQLCTSKAQPGDIKPFLQVWDLRLVNSQQQQQNTTERFRLMLSDGVHLQQGMLATQKNELVKSGRLQKGSIVQLTQFVCNVIQNRMIIIIIDLELIVEKCTPIGQPRQFFDAPSGGPSPVASSLQPSTDRPTLSGGYTGTNASPGYSISEPGVISGPPSYPGMHGDPNMVSRNPNPRPEILRPPSNTYSRPPQSAYQPPPPMYGNRGPIAKNEAPVRIIPISALNPYQGRWTIKARVTSKSELRHYNNPRGDGKVFSFDLLDSEGGEIRATCFNSVADQFYSQIEVGKIYMITKGTLKSAQKAFNHLRNDQELTLDTTSTVQPCFDDDKSIPQQQFHFRPISDLENIATNSIMDVIGVVYSVSPSSSIMRKNGTEVQKRAIHLKDISGRSVELTLWGSFCTSEGQTLQHLCDSGTFPVLAVKSARVSDFSGKEIGTISSSQLFIEPDFPEAQELKLWFEKEGKNTPSYSISKETSSLGRTTTRKTISQIVDEKLGTSEKPDWINICATISFVKSDTFCYTACPNKSGERQCNKKVSNSGDGKWHCEKCDQSFDNCDYRYLLQLQLQDHTGLTWVTAFQETGEDIIGIPAKDLYSIKYEEQDDERFTSIMKKVLFTKYLFKLKVKEETFSDEQRVKSTIVKADKVVHSSEGKFLLELLDKLKCGEPSAPVLLPKTENVVPKVATMNTSGYANIGMQANQVGPYGNPYSGSRATQPGSYMSCNSCGGTGHTSTSCPSIMSGPGVQPYINRAPTQEPSGGDNKNQCYKCHQIGHWARDCPGFGSSTAGATGGGNTNSGECYKCQQTGHWARDCPGLGSAAAAPASYVPPGRYGGSFNQRFG